MKVCKHGRDVLDSRIFNVFYKSNRALLPCLHSLISILRGGGGGLEESLKVMQSLDCVSGLLENVIAEKSALSL